MTKVTGGFKAKLALESSVPGFQTYFLPLLYNSILILTETLEHKHLPQCISKVFVIPALPPLTPLERQVPFIGFHIYC